MTTLLQESLTLFDIGTFVSILSFILALIATLYAWIKENRAKRRATAMDAIANRLLPFYGLVLEAMSKLNLFMMMYSKVSYSELRIDPQVFHERAGEAFVYMRETSSRQLVVNVIQIFEAIDLLKAKVESEAIVARIAKLLPLLGLLKEHIETYLEKYSDSLDVPSPDVSTLNEIGSTHAEKTLLEVVNMGSESTSDHMP